MTRIVVCGGRDLKDYRLVAETLWWLTLYISEPVICTGACPTGADALAERWAHAMRYPVRRYHADWEKHGKAAGPIRNEEMAADNAGGRLVAFPGGRGTADMVQRAEKHGMKIRKVEE